MVRNLGFFRLLLDVIVVKVTLWVSVLDKHEEITHDLSGIVPVLEAGRKCLLGPRCRPVYSWGSVLCLQDLLLYGCGIASCEMEDLCLICNLSLLTRRVCFFLG